MIGSPLSSLICDTDALRGYPISCCQLVSQQQNILLWASLLYAWLHWRSGGAEVGWGWGCGWGWGEDDIIYVLGGEIVFGIRAGASLGWDLVVLAYISALSCIVLAIPADNGSLLCLGPPPHPPSLCLCVHLFSPVLLSSPQCHRACYSSVNYPIYCKVWCRQNPFSESQMEHIQ